MKFGVIKLHFGSNCIWTTPDYELTGKIEALEEYDNENVWFAHFSFRLQLTRLHDDRMLYSRRFDDRKQVHQRNPEYVVQELSRIMDVRMSQVLQDIDAVLAREYGVDAGTDDDGEMPEDTLQSGVSSD